MQHKTKMVRGPHFPKGVPILPGHPIFTYSLASQPLFLRGGAPPRRKRGWLARLIFTGSPKFYDTGIEKCRKSWDCTKCRRGSYKFITRTGSGKDRDRKSLFSTPASRGPSRPTPHRVEDSISTTSRSPEGRTEGSPRRNPKSGERLNVEERWRKSRPSVASCFCFSMSCTS